MAHKTEEELIYTALCQDVICLQSYKKEISKPYIKKKKLKEVTGRADGWSSVPDHLAATELKGQLGQGVHR